MSTFRTVLELIYFISGPVLVVIAAIGLRQLKIAKEASRVQATREALSLSADRCNHYSLNIIPSINVLDKAIKDKNIKFFDLFDTKVDGDNINIYSKVLEEEIRKEHEKLELITSELVSVYNSLETFSVFFIHGVADEEVAFSSVGTTFCYTVRKYLPELFPLTRTTGHYQNLMRLFILWNTRIEAEKLKKDREKIENELNKITNKFVKPIGTE